MLKLKIVTSEDYDEEQNKFIVETKEIELEHSLASLSKWEAIWEVPLLSTSDKTPEQQLSYLECMCLTPNTPPELFYNLSEEQQNQIADYIDSKQSATWFSDRQPKPRNNEVITAELLYYWMSGFQIDWQAQYWHLNKLMTLIKVHSVKADNKPQRQSARNRQDELMRLNAQRRAELGSKG